MYYLKVEIPQLPKSFNTMGYAHWWTKSKEANFWRDTMKVATLGKLPKTPLEKAFVRYTRYSSRSSDYDGLVSSFKFVQDSLVFCKILKNDTLEVIEEPKYCWSKVPNKKGKITVEVWCPEAWKEYEKTANSQKPDNLSK